MPYIHVTRHKFLSEYGIIDRLLYWLDF